MFHSRVEYAFTDLLGDIGGTVELLVKISIFIFGGYFSFRSSTVIMKELYSSSAIQLDKLNKSQAHQEHSHEGGSIELN